MAALLSRGRIKNPLDYCDSDNSFGPFNKPLPATNGDDLIRGSWRNDTISAKGGNDTVFGGEGNDKLYGDDGNDKLYGENGSDMLDGGKGADMLFGGAGRDMLIGGKDNDVIDGGSDVDTLVLSGVKGQYDFHHNGDGSTTVRDLLKNRDGTDIVIDVENVRFCNGQTGDINDLGKLDLSFFPDANVPSSLLVGGQYLPYGSQSTHGTGFGIVTTEDGTSLGLATRYRTVDDPEAPVSSVVENGGKVLHNTYHLNDGAQSVANGSNSDNAARASGNTDYFVGDNDTSIASLINQGFQFKLSFMSSTGVDVHLHAVVNLATPTDIQWVQDGTNAPYISDDGGNPLAPLLGSFNSQNIAAFYDPAHNFGPRTENVELLMLDAKGLLLAGVHDTIIYA